MYSNPRNQVRLIGRLGKDPEHRQLESGSEVCTFSMATSETYKNKQGEKVDKTEWHNIVAWGPLAGIISKWCKKGQEILIDGKITTRSYDSEQGKKYITEIVASNMLMFGDGRTEHKEPGGNPTQLEQQAKQDNHEKIPNQVDVDTIGEDDDLPF